MPVVYDGYTFFVVSVSEGTTLPLFGRLKILKLLIDILTNQEYSKRMRDYNPAVPAVMRLIKEGKITIKDAASVLSCDDKTVKNFMKEFGVEVVLLGTPRSRKEASEANKKRNELLGTLAKAIKYDKADLHELAETHSIPSRTLYRWLHRV